MIQQQKRFEIETTLEKVKRELDDLRVKDKTQTKKIDKYER